jgi:hypothetical protein
MSMFLTAPNSAAALFSSSLLFVTSAAAGSLIFYARTRPHWREWLLVVSIATFLTGFCGLFGSAVAQLTLVAAYLSAGAFLVSAGAPFFAPQQSDNRMAVMRMMLLPPVLLFGVAVSLNALGAWWAGATVDVRLFAADASFGIGQPSFGLASIVVPSPFLRTITEAAYVHLPLADILVFAALQEKSPADANRCFQGLLFVGVVGALAYFLCPGVGTAAIFGDRYPFGDPNPAALFVTPASWLPRSCMPSVHTASGLILLWATPAGSRMRTLVIAYLIPMLTYTLVCGHYLVDLIAAVPFALAIDRAVARRWAQSAASFSLFGLWLLAVLLGGEFLARSPLLPWSLTIGTLALCWHIRSPLRWPRAMRLRVE